LIDLRILYTGDPNQRIICEPPRRIDFLRKVQAQGRIAGRKYGALLHGCRRRPAASKNPTASEIPTHLAVLQTVFLHLSGVTLSSWRNPCAASFV
jgi:hypothetical protein